MNQDTCTFVFEMRQNFRLEIHFWMMDAVVWDECGMTWLVRCLQMSKLLLCNIIINRIIRMTTLLISG